MKKVCIITATRAEYGLLIPIIHQVLEDKQLELQLVVTGTHLSSQHGLTYKEIQRDGFTINEKIDVQMNSDSQIGISKTMGLIMISFAECFKRLMPDMVIILGDRYEMMAIASVATVLKIPICHMYGGETTEGAFDEAFRHSITKMSYLHFTSTEAYRKRVIQLGEDPQRVFNVGATGVENIKKIRLLSKEQIEEQIHFRIDDKTLLVTFHPETLEKDTAEEQFKALLTAINELKECKVIFTNANADIDGNIINHLIKEYVINHEDKAISFSSLGQLRYLSVMKYVGAVVGNSSSGIIEAPSLGTPTVNIGDRQKGRIRANTVIDCLNNKESIVNAIYKALSKEFKDKIKQIENPYEGKDTSTEIISIIKKHFTQNNVNLKKTFYNIPFTNFGDLYG